MSNFLRITVRFLDPEPSFHGKRDGDETEWPPSPLRLFQALVDAAANRWREQQFNNYARPALEWMERLPSSEIVAPAHQLGTPYRIAVPNNDLDVWAGPISKGNEPKKQQNELKTMKTVQPARILTGKANEGDAVHYLFPLPQEGCPHLEVLRAASRSITHLGWGIDMASGNAEVISEVEAAELKGHHWRAVPAGGVPLRIPTNGTLQALMAKHTAFLNRLSDGGFRPVPPLTAFETQGYSSPTVESVAKPRVPMAAFKIIRTLDDQEANPGKSEYRPFHHVRQVATVAGMVRHATAHAARTMGWEINKVQRCIEGHGEEKDGQSTSDDRLLFLPLPSVTPYGIAAIRRVLIVAPPGFDMGPFRRRLNGEELIDRDTCNPAAMLTGLATTDKGEVPYVGQSCTWSTVTPVILPGYDDPSGLRRKLRERNNPQEQKNLLERLDTRILALLWKAFRQAGWTDDALAGAELEYRKVGWFQGLDLAGKYDLPPLKFPRYHVRVRFKHPVTGPLAVGAGRYRGFGLFAIDE